MDKLVVAMAPLCSIYDASFRNLLQELELGFGEDLIGKVDFVLHDSLYNSQKDRNDAHAAYYMFGLNDMKDMANVLGDVIKPGAHVHAFCSTLRFALWLNSIAVKQKEERENTEKQSSEGGSESEESESAEL